MNISAPHKVNLSKSKASNQDLQKFIDEGIRISNGQVGNGFAKKLNGGSERKTAENIHKFLRKNTKYVKDGQLQVIKSARSLIKDKKGDCKSYSVFASSVLTKNGIPHSLAYTSYNNDPTPSHVYVQTDGGYVIDAVLPKFNQEAPYTYKHKKKVRAKLISGIGGYHTPKTMGKTDCGCLGGMTDRYGIGQVLPKSVQTYSYDRFDFPEGGEKKWDSFTTKNAAGYIKYLQPLTFKGRDGKVYLKQGVTKSQWEKRRFEAVKLDEKNRASQKLLVDARAERLKREAAERNKRRREEAAASRACQSRELYDQAVGVKKKDGLHTANKLNPLFIAARGAILGLLRINALGLASILNLKGSKDYEIFEKQCKTAAGLGYQFAKDCVKKGCLPPSSEKIQRILYNLGFEPNSVINENKPWRKATGKGALKKPFATGLLKLLPTPKYEKTLKDTIQWYKTAQQTQGSFWYGKKIYGVEFEQKGIGEVGSTAAAITAAMPIIAKLLPLIMKIPSVSEQVPDDECDIQEADLKRVSDTANELEKKLKELQGGGINGFGQGTPSVQTQNEASQLGQQVFDLFKSTQTAFDIAKQGKCKDIALRYESEINRLQLLKSEFDVLKSGRDSKNPLKGGTGGGVIKASLGGQLLTPLLISGGAIYLLNKTRAFK